MSMTAKKTIFLRNIAIPRNLGVRHKIGTEKENPFKIPIYFMVNPEIRVLRGDAEEGRVDCHGNLLSAKGK